MEAMHGFDMQEFLESLGGDQELAEELMAVYLEDAPERLSALKQAMLEGDMEAVTRLSHSLKGMSGVIRAQGLVEMALRMEIASRGGDINAARDVFDSFQESIRTTLDLLSQKISQ